MIAAASSDGSSWISRTISSAERSASRRGAGLGTELAERLHREAAVALGEQREGGVAVLVGELRKQLREVGRVLLLKQVDQVGGRPHALEALHRVEHDIELALGHGQSDPETELLNVTRRQRRGMSGRLQVRRCSRRAPEPPPRQRSWRRIADSCNV